MLFVGVKCIWRVSQQSVELSCMLVRRLISKFSYDDNRDQNNDYYAAAAAADDDDDDDDDDFCCIVHATNLLQILHCLLWSICEFLTFFPPSVL